MAKHNVEFRSPDGTTWRVEVRSPGSSNAAVVFHHPSDPRLNRYGWFLSHGTESRSVTARLDPETVLKALEPRQLQRLFRQSYAISPAETPYNRQISRAS